jgi:catechol 2,3-dioxygenase-like lactoylglutathione lyase family enzyme
LRLKAAEGISRGEAGGGYPETVILLCAAFGALSAAGDSMKVQRIVANVRAVDPALAEKFYGDILGLDLLMDMHWIRTYGSKMKMSVQLSFMSEGGSGTSVPDLSVEVDDLDVAIDKFTKSGFEIEYGPVVEPWGVRRFFVRDPFGRLVNVLSHVDVSGRSRRSVKDAA